MRLDEDLGPRHDHNQFQIDDEENQTERDCCFEDDTDSEVTVPTRNPSDDCIDDDDVVNTCIWPQSYRQSMDMYTSFTPPPISFLSSLSRTNSSLSTACKKQNIADNVSSLSKPLLSRTNLEEEERLVPAHTPSKVLLSSAAYSISELPPLHEQCSYVQSVLNGVNVLCGVGLLTTPYAIREGGWFSMILLAIFASTSCYTGILLKKCLESSPSLKTYPDIGQAAFGMAGRLSIAIVLYVELYATCVEYLILLTGNLASLFPNTHMEFSGVDLDSHQICAITAALIVLPTVWLKNLSWLSYLSAGGIISSLIVAFCLLWVGVVDQVGFHPSGTVLDLANITVAVGIFGFGFAGHSVFPNIYTSMKEPSRFPLVLILSFGFCFVMYSMVAISGFLMFGDAVKSQFTLNMPTQFVASKIAIWTTVVIPITKYAMTLTPIVLGLEELLPSPELRTYRVSLLIRTTLVLSTLIVALTIPFFGLVMALIGSLLAMLVALIFPCACYLRLLNGRLSVLHILGCVFIIIGGIFCAIIGTYSAISKIADKVAD